MLEAQALYKPNAILRRIKIIDAKFKKVVYAYREPAIFVDCEGHAMLEKAGLTVIENTVFAPLVIRQNAHLLSGA